MLKNIIMTCAGGLCFCLSVSPVNAQSNSNGGTAYLDHLKTCSPYSVSYQNPLVQGSTSQNIIKGPEGSNCGVTFVLPNNMKLECSFSQEAIKAMTSEAEYQSGRSGTMSGSTSSAQSQYAQKQCHTWMNGKQLN